MTYELELKIQIAWSKGNWIIQLHFRYLQEKHCSFFSTLFPSLTIPSFFLSLFLLALAHSTRKARPQSSSNCSDSRVNQRRQGPPNTFSTLYYCNLLGLLLRQKLVKKLRFTARRAMMFKFIKSWIKSEKTLYY